MHEEPLVVIIILTLMVIVGGSLCGIVGLVLTIAGRREVARLKAQVNALLEKPGRLDRASMRAMPDSAAVQTENGRETAAPFSSPPSKPLPPPVPPATHGPDASPVPEKEVWSAIEQWIGAKWLTWIGTLALFLSMGFLVKYAIDNQWVGPSGRIALAVLFGMTLMILGDRAVRRAMRAFGLALMGGGLSILYVSLYGAFKLYSLISPEITAALLIFVTIGGMALAIVHDSRAMAIMAMLGGFLTPLIASTGENSREALFTYIVLLDLGVLGVALFKRWRVLDAVAFVGTVCLYSGWYHEYYTVSQMLPALLWLVGFYAIFLILPFAYHFRTGTPVTVERFALALANAVYFCTFCYIMLYPDHHYALGFIALGISSCYTLLGSLIRKRIATDVKTLFGFIVLAVVFLTLAVPLQLKLNGILLAWAVEGPVLLALGYRFRYFPLRVTAFGVLALAAIRLFVMHWPLHNHLYFEPLLNTRFWTAMSVPIAGWLFAIIHSSMSRDTSQKEDRLLKEAAAIGAGFVALIVLSVETAGWISSGWALRGAEQRFIWPEYAVLAVMCLGGTAFVGTGVLWRSLASRLAGMVPFVIALILSVAVYCADMICWNESWPVLNIRFMLVLMALVLAYFCAKALRQRTDICNAAEQMLGTVMFWITLATFLALLSAEAFDSCVSGFTDLQTGRWIGQMAVSIVWGAYAAVLLVVGFLKKKRPLRLVALGLFCATGLKLVLVDISSVKQIYRIVAFVVLGMMMVSASYLYHRIAKSLGTDTGGRS